MSLESETLRCASPECQVCNLHSKLVEHGAEAVSLFDLEENLCRLNIQTTDTLRCLYTLRLDIDEAEYRFVRKGQVTRMCDFAVLAVTGGVAQIVAIELKSGAASPEDINQLREGLRVLHDYFDENGLTPNPTAYFVVGRDLDKLRFALRDKLASLRFGSTRVKLQILECGGHLHLE